MRSRQRVILTLRKNRTFARGKPVIEKHATKTRAMKGIDLHTMY